MAFEPRGSRRVVCPEHAIPKNELAEALVEGHCSKVLGPHLPRLVVQQDVAQHGAGEYHYTVMEAVTVPGELLCFRPLEVGETAHATSMHAWFAGIGAVRNIEGSRG